MAPDAASLAHCIEKRAAVRHIFFFLRAQRLLAQVRRLAADLRMPQRPPPCTMCAPLPQQPQPHSIAATLPCNPARQGAGLQPHLACHQPPDWYVSCLIRAMSAKRPNMASLFLFSASSFTCTLATSPSSETAVSGSWLALATRLVYMDKLGQSSSVSSTSDILARRANGLSTFVDNPFALLPSVPWPRTS